MIKPSATLDVALHSGSESSVRTIEDVRRLVPALHPQERRRKEFGRLILARDGLYFVEGCETVTQIYGKGIVRALWASIFRSRGVDTEGARILAQIHGRSPMDLFPSQWQIATRVRGDVLEFVIDECHRRVMKEWIHQTVTGCWRNRRRGESALARRGHCRQTQVASYQ